jgi:hypothetical protein
VWAKFDQVFRLPRDGTSVVLDRGMEVWSGYFEEGQLSWVVMGRAAVLKQLREKIHYNRPFRVIFRAVSIS